MMLMAGTRPLGRRHPSRRPGRPGRPRHRRPRRRPTALAGAYLFQDEFDGPWAQAPDPANWTVQNWQDDVLPPVHGAYTATIAETYSSTATPISSCSPPTRRRPVLQRQTARQLAGPHRPHVGSANQARLPVPRLWPSFWAVNEDPLPDGEVDIFEWYGNGIWPPGTTVHAASNGKTWEGRSIPGLVDGAWHTWRMRWDEDGFKFWRDYVDGAKPYFSVPPKPIPVHGRPGDLRWPFNNPGYWLSAHVHPRGRWAWRRRSCPGPVFPAAMLVDWIRVW